MNRRSLLYLLASSCISSFDFITGASAQPYTPPQAMSGDWRFTPDPKLPNILLIGDSISNGYTRDVRQLLHGKANVFRPMEPGGNTPVNCGDTNKGLANLSSWLGDVKWKIIHFNWGLHDLHYRLGGTTTGRADKIHGEQQVPLPEYKVNMEQLVSRLEKTGAILVWATTTVVPEGEPGRFVGDVVKYNQVAREIMVEHGIRIDDLYTLTKKFPANFTRPHNVHYTKEGYMRIARQVADCLSGILAGRSTGRHKLTAEVEDRSRIVDPEPKGSNLKHGKQKADFQETLL